MATTIWTIVPMRGIEAGKSRLAAVLDAASRARLNRWLLSHTLAVIERWHGDLKRCVVVSPCDQALELARRAGAAVVREAQGANNLNRALALGAAHAHAHGAGRILVLPCDLPELTAESLHEFAGAAQPPRHMLLAPDAAGTGTNALLVDFAWGGEFCFGERSCARHQACAVARSWTISIYERREFAFDLDTPRDLAAWSQSGAARRDVRITPHLRYITRLEAGG
jgi:2-phospho-L-lactate guanylyltransferase